MTIWEWGLFIGAAIIALQILISLMSYYHQLYRQEYLTEYLQKQQQTAPDDAADAPGQHEQRSTPTTPPADARQRPRTAA